MSPEPVPPNQSDRASSLIALLVVAGLSLAVNVWVTHYWYNGERNETSGDEPHYLFIADSLYRDQDFSLANNYADDLQRQILSRRPLNRHVTGARTYSGHSPGLGILLAVPFGVRGVLGAKLFLCLLATIVPIAIFRWMSPLLGAAHAALLTIALTVGLPLAVAANQIYPDGVAGVLTLFLMYQVARWTLGGSSSSPGESTAAVGTAQLVVFALVAGFLPWLHVKYLAPALVLTTGAWLATAARPRVRQAMALFGPLLLLGALLAIYNYAGFGTVLGVRRVGEVLPPTDTHPANPPWLTPMVFGGFGFDVVRIVQYFLGFHLDQAQGMFIQQPLFLFALAGLLPMLRQSRVLTIVWLLTYASLILPSAMSLSYGSFSPAGRFTWSVVFLWAIPLRFALAAALPYARTALPIACGLSLIYQGWLARLWLPAPLTLYPTVHPSLWARNSLFEGPIRQALPSMYNVFTVFAYVPNWVFTALAVLLLVSGAALAGSMSHRRLRTVWIVFGVICAVIYPPAAPAWEVPVNVQQHVSGLMDEVESLVVRRFEAEQLPSSLDRTSRVADEGASGGFIRRSAVTRPSELVLYGPYLNLPAGRYRVEWTLKLEAPAPEDVIAGVDVVSEADRTTRLAHRWVTRAEVGTEGFTRVTAEFASAVPLKGVEFRLFSEKDVVLRVDHVELIPLRAALRRGWFTGSR